MPFPRRLGHRALTLVAAAGLTVTLTAGPATAEPDGVVTNDQSSTQSVRERMAKTQTQYAAGGYEPGNKLVINNPLGNDAAKWRVNDELFKAIAHAKKGSTIRIATFNINSPKAVDLLIKAHQRGVRVGVLAGYKESGPSISRLQRAFGGSTRSYAKMCKGSCRGKRGTLHSKIYTFSHTGRVRNLTMYSTGNVTKIAAEKQWASLRVWPNNKAMYDWNVALVNQMRADRPVANAYRARSFGPRINQIWQPNYGAGAPGDPVMRILAPIKCKGARTGANGRTVLNISTGGWHDDRGIKIAKRVRQLWNNGCQVRVMYAKMGPRIKGILRNRSGRGPIPLREIMFYRNASYPTYLHVKAFQVNGYYGNNRSTRRIWDGSPNISTGALRSDEQIYGDTNLRIFKKYAAFHNNLWSSRAFPRTIRSMDQARAEAPTFTRSDGTKVNSYDAAETN